MMQANAESSESKMNVVPDTDEEIDLIASKLSKLNLNDTDSDFAAASIPMDLLDEIKTTIPLVDVSNPEEMQAAESIPPKFPDEIKPTVPIDRVADLLEIQNKMELASCDEEACTLLDQDLEFLKEYYNNWDKFFNRIEAVALPEVARWEGIKEQVLEKLKNNDFSNKPTAMIQLVVCPEEDPQRFTLPKGMVYIKNRIYFLKKTLKNLEIDRSYVKVQREKIVLIEDWLEIKKAFLEYEE